MAKNTGNGNRNGCVIERSQCFNPKTESYVKRDSVTGKFISSKKTPYKGVKKEKEKITNLIKKNKTTK